MPSAQSSAPGPETSMRSTGTAKAAQIAPASTPTPSSVARKHHLSPDRGADDSVSHVADETHSHGAWRATGPAGTGRAARLGAAEVVGGSEFGHSDPTTRCSSLTAGQARAPCLTPPALEDRCRPSGSQDPDLPVGPHRQCPGRRVPAARRGQTTSSGMATGHSRLALALGTLGRHGKGSSCRSGASSRRPYC